MSLLQHAAPRSGKLTAIRHLDEVIRYFDHPAAFRNAPPRAAHWRTRSAPIRSAATTSTASTCPIRRSSPKAADGASAAALRGGTASQQDVADVAPRQPRARPPTALIVTPSMATAPVILGPPLRVSRGGA